jgi:hypothetical protein
MYWMIINEVTTDRIAYRKLKSDKNTRVNANIILLILKRMG